jgi:hypothetical protein
MSCTQLIGKGGLANGRLPVVLVSPREMKVGKERLQKEEKQTK